MNRKINENNLMIDFTQKILSEIVSIPSLMIREYQLLGIDEKECIILLRILHSSFKNGCLNLESIAQEFSVGIEEAQILVTPFLEKNLLEEGPDNCLSYNGIINCFFEHWISTQRKSNNKNIEKKVAVKGPSEKEKILIKNLSYLYHIFEKELGKNLSPIQNEELRNWLEKDQTSLELIEEALKRAVLQEKRTFSYIKSILNKWREAGIKDLKMVLENDNKHKQKRFKADQKLNEKDYYRGIYEKF